MTPEQAAAALLARPGVREADHHGKPSFRNASRILATVPGPGLLNVIADEATARSAVADDPDAPSALSGGARALQPETTGPV